MDGQMDDGRKVITIAHPEHSSGELKKKKKKKKKNLFELWLYTFFFFILCIYITLGQWQLTPEICKGFVLWNLLSLRLFGTCLYKLFFLLLLLIHVYLATKQGHIIPRGVVEGVGGGGVGRILMFTDPFFIMINWHKFLKQSVLKLFSFFPKDMGPVLILQQNRSRSTQGHHLWGSFSGLSMFPCSLKVIGLVP